MGQPAIFRVLTLLDRSVDEELERLGYTSEGESCVLYGSLDDVESGRRFGSDASLAAEPRVVRSNGGAAGSLLRAGPNLSQHRRPARNTGGFRHRSSSEGETVAAAYGALHRGLLCFESVITGGRRRRQGYGRRIVMALAAWAKEEGASGACLEVEAGNLPARTLYDAVGLNRELYRYHYRREPRASVVTKL